MPSLDYAQLPAPTGSKTRTNPSGRKLSSEQATQLQLEYRQPGVTTAYLGQKYGISQQSAYRIATGRLYAELPTAPARPKPKLTWTDPPPRRRGLPSDEEVKGLVNALKSNVGNWALVKKTTRRPQTDCWRDLGVEAEGRKLTNGGWGLFLRWPDRILAVA